MIDPALKQAADQSRAAENGGFADAHDLMILALEAAATDNHDRAKALFDRALALEPDNPALLTGLASWYRTLGRLRDAVLACDAAIRIAPDYADAWLERGAILGVGGSSRAARDSFAEAVRLNPANPVALAGLAGQAARDGDMVVARDAAKSALTLDPANLAAAAALAQALLADGDAAAARSLLAPRVASAGPGHVRSLAAHALGRAEERLGDHAAAYAAYALSKADFATVNASAAASQLGHTEFVEAIAAAVAGTDRAAWRGIEADQPDNAVDRHIFLLGYPRSGTTLVENILASLPGVAALEEWPTLAETDQLYLSGGPRQIVDGLAEFLALAPAGRMALRSAYWSRIAATGVPRDATAFVDMDPLKGTRLPYIAALFPGARVLVMRRDPRDVVWSCFRTNFAMTSNTFEYSSLERAARHYDAMMRLTDLVLDRLPLTAMDVDYRDLVRDLDATTQAICAFAGLAWSPAVRDFDATANRRGVGTASAAQVRKGLYDGSGQWKPFAQWLEPVLPILAPWIERYGHD